MKKFILTTVLIVIAMFASISASANGNITVYVDGQYLESSAPVLTVADRTMVPMRDICEALGYRVEWNGGDQSIVVSGGSSDNMRLSMRINTYSMNRLVKSNSPCQITINLDVPPMLINDKTYLPIRALSEALFFDVEWDGVTSTVYIKSPDYRIGSTSADEWSKLLLYGENDAETRWDQVGLTDLYGNVIIPYGPAPTYEEVFNRTDLMEIINDIDYSRIVPGMDGGWSSWDYRVYVYDDNDRMILMANYALDGSVHYIDYQVYDRDGSWTTYLIDEDAYFSGRKSLKDSLYKFSFDDQVNRKRIYYNIDGSYKSTYYYSN